MLEVMLWMAAGLIAGRLFRLKNLQKIILAMTWLLLLFLGWEAGGDSNVVKALPSLGLDALILTAGGTAGSCILAWLLWKSLKDRENDGGNGGNGRSDGVMAGLSGSLVILGLFVAGILLGLAGFDLGEGLVHKLGYRSLCILMLLVGMSAGGNPELVSSLKSMNPRIVLLPVATVAGTYIGCVLVNIALGYRTTDVLAIGSGFGYYSLSSVLISGSRGAELGTLALISNIIREVFTLLCTPLLAKMAGPLAPISAGGATTADTTLPVITGCCGERFALVSIFHGFIVDFSVPFLVSFFCSLG